MGSQKVRMGIVIILLSLPLRSAIAWVTDGSASVGSTSDGIAYQYFSVKAITHPIDVTYPYKGETEDAFAWGLYAHTNLRNLYSLHTTSSGLGALLSKRFASHFQLDASLGFDTTSTSGDPTSYSAANGSVKIGSVMDDTLSWYLEGQHRLASLASFVHDRFNPHLRANRLNGGFSHRLLPSLKLDGTGNLAYLTDSNVKRYAELNLLYGISTGEPWFWVGFGGYTMGFEHRTGNYWSPSKMKGLGPVVDFTRQISEDWSVLAGGNLMRMEEEDFGWNWGSYSSLGIQWKDRDHTNASLQWNHIRSYQRSAVWLQNEVVLSVSIFWDPVPEPNPEYEAP